MLAEEMHRPGFAFTRQAISSWLHAVRIPRLEHRKALATVLGVSLRELSQKCEVNTTSEIGTNPFLRNVAVHVFGSQDLVFHYSLALAKGVELSKLAVYTHWADMFAAGSSPLKRHFRTFRYRGYAWIPDSAAHPHVLRPPCLVPLGTDRTSPENGTSNDRKVWLFYDSGGVLRVGLTYREGRSLFLLQNGKNEVQRYPLGRVDLVGYVQGKTLFHIPNENLVQINGYALPKVS
ncbi:MAG: hypothetical protein JWQ87_5249 [Candidatus Sulfotelmatobacter sp.]|nr:hypothetical protein [Candidatus Sulfotelmatobacter sp.]